eukprot:scaffold1023_cov313-Pinguiococcus_pyrenoidosus.AAC.8
MVLRGQDAWRRHPLLINCHRGMFPGLNYALGIFGVYLVVKYSYAAMFPPQRHSFPAGPFHFVKEGTGEVPEPVFSGNH